MCFFQGWAGPGGVGPQIGAALGALVSFNLRYSNLAARSAKQFFEKNSSRGGVWKHTLRPGSRPKAKAKGQAKEFIKTPSSQIGAEGKGKGQTKGSIKTPQSRDRGRKQRQRPSQGIYKNALKPDRGRRQRQRPSQGIYKNTLKPRSGLEAKAKSKQRGL